MDTLILKEYYSRYLKEICGVKDSTVKHYNEALRHISKYLVELGKIDESIYEVKNLEDLENIRTYLKSDNDFMELDKRGHQMYTAGLNNYLKFANGTDFVNLHEEIKKLDVDVPAPEKKEVVAEYWKRSTIIKSQVIEAAGYQCEINPNHKTFTAKSNGHQYMEAHHALPMKYQKNFNSSLDVYANVICLCPICHRLIHYGVSSEKKGVLEKIYYDRADRLAVSGIKMSLVEFENMVV